MPERSGEVTCGTDEPPAGAAEGALEEITVSELIRKISDELTEEPSDVTEGP